MPPNTTVPSAPIGLVPRSVPEINGKALTSRLDVVWTLWPMENLILVGGGIGVGVGVGFGGGVGVGTGVGLGGGGSFGARVVAEAELD